MELLSQQIKTATNQTTIEIAFDLDRTPREQVETAIARVKPRTCSRHPHEVLSIDKAATLDRALRWEPPNNCEPRQVEFTATYERCDECPFNEHGDNLEVENCPVDILSLGKLDFTPRDQQRKPLPRRVCRVELKPDVSVRDQFEKWLVREAEIRCRYSDQVLRRLNAQVRPPDRPWRVDVAFISCPQCTLERLGLTPDEARVSFENFKVNPPELRQHVEACRKFASAPNGVLLLLGHCGTGKTHLAVSILRELVRQGRTDLQFIKHRDFLAEHRLAMRPVAFREKPPESPMARCRKAGLLVYDDLTAPIDGRGCEDELLDLFDDRIGRYRPSIITSNVGPRELEAIVGTRLFDRLRRATFAVLEFGFESKRGSLNEEYLKRV